MDLTRTAYGTWNGGRFLRFGEALDEQHVISLTQHAYERGIRTFLSADIYGNGAADLLLGKALKGIPRDSYCLVGMIGHDFYKGQRVDAKGYPRFTETSLRGTLEYADYIHMATEKGLERCGASHYDCLMLHNPDFTGFSSDAVWKGLDRMKDQKLTHRLGVAPGPANGFTLDLLLCFERFGALLDWAMVIFNPLESWPARLCLEGARRHNIKLISRMVDHAGLFHGDVQPGHVFGASDFRSVRSADWIEAGTQKIDSMRPIAERHGLTLLQLACLWNLSQSPVECVIPTLTQEIGVEAKAIEEKVEELASLPLGLLEPEEVAEVMQIGENKGCIELKGGNPAHIGVALPDRWLLNSELLHVAKRWGIEPEHDLVCSLSHPG